MTSGNMLGNHNGDDDDDNNNDDDWQPWVEREVSERDKEAVVGCLSGFAPGRPPEWSHNHHCCYHHHHQSSLSSS